MILKSKEAASIIVDDLNGKGFLCDAKILGDFIQTAFQLDNFHKAKIINIAQEIHDRRHEPDFLRKGKLKGFLKDKVEPMVSTT